MSNNGLKNKNEIINKTIDNTEVLCNISRYHGNVSLKIDLISTLGAHSIDFFLYIDSYNANNIGFGLGATCSLYKKIIYANNKYTMETFDGLEYEFEFVETNKYYNSELDQKILKQPGTAFRLFDGFGNIYNYSDNSNYPSSISFGQSGYSVTLTISNSRVTAVQVKSHSRTISTISITYTLVGNTYYATTITCTKPNNVYTLTYNSSGRISNITSKISGSSNPFSDITYAFNQYDIMVTDNIRSRRCKVERGFNQQAQTYIVSKIEEDYYENSTSIEKITTNIGHNGNNYTKVYDNNGNYVELYYDNEQIEYIVDSNCNLQKCLYDDHKRQIGNYSSISFLKKYVDENNLVKNGYFENSSHLSYWHIVGTSSGGISYDNNRPLSNAIGPYYAYLNNTSDVCWLEQEIDIKGSELDNYTLVLWVKQLALGVNSNSDLSIEVKYNTSDSVINESPYIFVKDIPHSSTLNPNWHPLIFDVSRHKNFDSIDLMIKLPNTGVQYAIDGVILLKNKVLNESSYYLFGKKEKQDDKDEIINYVHNYHDDYYNIDKLGMIIDNDGIITRYSYDEDCVNVVSEENCNRTIQRVYEESEKNNLLSETVLCGSKKMVSSNVYTESHDYIKKEISHDDSETTYNTNEAHGNVTQVNYPNGNNAVLSFNDLGLNDSISKNGNNFSSSLSYLYNDMILDRIVRNNHNLYFYEYDEFKPYRVTLQDSNLLLETYSYQNVSPYGISKIKKGSNGDEVKFIYDIYGNVEQVQYKLKGESSYSLKYKFEYDEVAHSSLRKVTVYDGNNSYQKEYAYDAIGNIKDVFDPQNGNYDMHYLYDDYKHVVNDIDIGGEKRIEVLPENSKEQVAIKKDLTDSVFYQLTPGKEKYFCFFNGSDINPNYLMHIFNPNKSSGVKRIIIPSSGSDITPINDGSNWYLPLSSNNKLKYLVPSEYINTTANSLINGSFGFLFVPSAASDVKTIFSLYDANGYSRIVCENIENDLLVKVYGSTNYCYEFYDLGASCITGAVNYFGFSFSLNLSTNENKIWLLINNKKYIFSFYLENELHFNAFNIGSYKAVDLTASSFKLYSLMFMPLNCNVNVLNITGLSKNYHLLKDIYEASNETEDRISMDTFPTNTINSITDFIPLTTSFVSKCNKKPVYLNLRYEEDCIRNRYFKYNSLIKQNMLKMDGINLVYDLSLGNTFTIAMNVIFNKLMYKNYIYTIKDDNKYISLLSVNNQLYLDVNGTLTNVNITISADSLFFISLGLDYVVSSNSLVSDHYKVRIVVGNSLYESTINMAAFLNPLLIIGSKGANESIDYFMDGYINSLCYNNTYMSVTSVNTLRGEVKPVRSEAIIDGFGRINKKRIIKDAFKLEKTIAYKQVEETSQVLKDTMLVDSEIIKDNSNNTLLQRSYEYGSGSSYGNITKIKENGAIKNQFIYNSKGYLTTSYYNNEGKFDSFEFNNDGNITRKLTRHPTSLYVYSDISYGYDSLWPDRLVQVGDKKIEYDNDFIGCPKHYGYFDNNGVFTSGITYSWRLSKLIGLTDSTNNKTINYDYDEEGRRIRKTVNNINHYYYYEGNRLLSEIISNGKRLDFLYDESNDIIGFDYNVSGTTSRYYFIKNILGDVIKIVDSSGTVRVTYEYSAYGDILSISGSYASIIGDLNPIRYRSYYYDIDTDMYYLKTRYYNPNWCRFISSDNITYLEYDNPLNISLFRYCANNPVMNVDPDGNSVIGIIMLVIAAVVFTTTVVGEIVAYARSKNVYEKYKKREDSDDGIVINNGEIMNSNHVKNIFDIWALSMYARYRSGDNTAKGSAYGLFIEWICHNLGDAAGMSGGDKLNYGKTILSDFKDHHSLKNIMYPILMTAAEASTNPLVFIYDIARTIFQ